MITSGGEAMLQQEFIAELFTACKAPGSHTRLDTNGFRCVTTTSCLDRKVPPTPIWRCWITKQINDE